MVDGRVDGGEWVSVGMWGIDEWMVVDEWVGVDGLWWMGG